MTIKELVEQSHKNAKEKGFWDNILPGNKLTEPNIAEKLCLIHSEVSEALEAIRIKDYNNFAEELADILIRTADLAGYLNIDLEKEVIKKMDKNAKREYKHGKKF